MWLVLLLACGTPGPMAVAADSGDDETVDLTPVVCEPVSQLDANREPAAGRSGWAWCHPEGNFASGVFRRLEPVSCVTPLADLGLACHVTDESNECVVDADCGDGACMSSGGGDGTVCSCVTPCLDDADCADTEVCVCAAAIEQDLIVRAVAYYPSCQRAECHGQVDCPAECRGETSGSCGLGVGVIACDGAADTCANDADCAGLANGRCDYSYTDEAWSCVEGSTCM